MRFNKLDLNLLVALDALLDECSITRAAERLNLSQSATSNALARLREYFDDELLVQVGRRMEPTPRAESLREPVRDVLMRVDSTIAIQPEFDPARSNRRFKVIASDYTQLILGPHLMTLAQAQGCTAEIEFRPQVNNPQRDLERGEADFLIIPHRYTSPEHPSETLLEDRFVCVVWSGSVLAQGTLTRMRYENARHVMMVPPQLSAASESYEAMLIRQAGIQRRYGVLTHAFGPLPAMVVGTDAIATVHARMAHALQGAWPLVVKPVPVDLPAMPQSLQWHRYRSQDPGLMWLRDLFRAAVRRMDAQIEADGGDWPMLAGLRD
ncbi:LysR family transcriptional regulator [Ideonella livida]|uniref:LysR family transcriptional regulator n=1 Tax=Ideonella livida TaxID=2707176 RepID=A0A7C9TMQ0_9BURK|nr:LysR family transcriptional regulator [Ideonella livida]NDY91846.1 LysR family transcriptional regulator [Ideonella livida]